MSDEVKRAVNASLIPSRLAAESFNRGLQTIDKLIALGQRNDHSFLTSVEYLQQARDVATGFLHDGYAFAKAGVLIPVGLFGLSHGMTFPDLDISLLGIGYHRFFLFHSALGLVGLRYFYRQWLEKQTEPDRWANRVKGAKGCQVPFSFEERWGGIRPWVECGESMGHAKRVPDTLSPARTRPMAWRKPRKTR